MPTLSMRMRLASGARRTWYVDSAAGGGGNGSLATPWNSLASITGVTAGQAVALKRGSTFRSTLTAQAGVQYDAYGSGALPIVSGANAVTGMTQETVSAQETGGLFASGMETASFTDWSSVSQTAVTISRVTTSPAHGTYCAQITANGTATDNRGSLNKTGIVLTLGNTIYMRAYVKFPTGSLGGAGQWKGFNLGEIRGNLVWSGTAFTSIDVVMGNGGVFVGSFPTALLTLDAWHCVEFAFKIHASTGGVQIWVDGTSIGSDFTKNTSADAGTQTANLGNIGFSSILAANQSHFVDDFKISNTAIGLFSGGDNHRWSGALTTEPTQVFVAGTRGLRVATTPELTSTGKWHWASNVLTVYAATTSGTQPTVEASIRTYCINVPDAAHGVRVGSIQCDKPAEIGLNVGIANYFTSSFTTVTNAWIEGIKCSTLSDRRTNLHIYNPTVTGCGGSGIQLDGPVTDLVVTGFTITGCCTLHHQLYGASARHEFSAGIKYWGAETSGYTVGMLIGSGDIADCVPSFGASTSPRSQGVGIWLDHVVTPTGRPLVTDIDITNCQANGLYFEKTENCDGTRFRIRNVAQVQYSQGAVIECNNYPLGDALGNRLVNGTVYGAYWPVSLNWGDAGNIRNNSIINVIGIGGVQPEWPTYIQCYVATEAGNDTTHSSGNLIDHSNFGANAAGIIVVGGSSYSTIAAAQAAKAWITNCVAGDPLLVNPPTDWSLNTGSPARNAGVVVTGITDGYLGAAPDIGAVETV